MLNGNGLQDVAIEGLIKCDTQGPKEMPETGHQKNERLVAESSRRIGLLTFVIAGAAIASVIIGIFSYFVTRGQQNVMQRQLNEMQTQDRPWVEIDSPGIDFMKIAPNIINLSLHLALKNSGHIPATGIEISVRLYPVTNTERDSEDSEENATCVQAARDYPARTTDLTIFPGDTQDMFIEPSMPTNQVPLSPWHDGRRGAGFVALGCIDYYTSSSGTHGHTAFRYYIAAVGDKKNPTIPHIIYTDTATYGPDSLILTQPMWGNYAQ